ncbi:unnamed protein product [Caenorhabditis angaria]|uniref:Uncharacterized protein n=1 Tax=Caenorhabditis angaria TaxID=860376 RepID=A0A9P1IKH9_9PELO|nr:unnamed protein product [Caenorhabditis angaria]
MFSEHKKRQEDLKKDSKKELIFDELESKTAKMKVSDEGKKEKIYTSSEEINRVQKKRSIKKTDKKESSMSLNLSKIPDAAPSNRSNSVESSAAAVVPNMGIGIFEAASMIKNIVDITTDSTSKKVSTATTKSLKNMDSKNSVTSMSGSGPFAQLKEAQEQKKRNKHSFDEDES